MINVVLVVHLILAIALVGVVLLQKSEGGALGIGGGGGMSGFLTGRGAGNLLTRTTAILAASFIVTSLALAKLAETQRGGESILDQSAPPAQEQPEEPKGPAVPLAR
ncbi:MAG: preprotein translocase subunit SecG [Rhodospirillales bacterium]|nr:preprotein translocase subunit SecG [Rhodospirillales bacterium]